MALLDIPRLASQFLALERRTSRAGKDSVDHPPGGHDDVANAVAGALTMATGASEPGILAYYREECAAYERGDHPFSPARPKTIRVMAPAGVSHVQVLSGRSIGIPADRILELDESDAKPLIGAGWRLIGKEAA